MHLNTINILFKTAVINLMQVSSCPRVTMWTLFHVEYGQINIPQMERKDEHNEVQNLVIRIHSTQSKCQTKCNRIR